jgi:hypothetical protein
MNRKRAILTCCATFIAAVVVIAWPRGPKEPVYQGRKLSEWLDADVDSGYPSLRDKDASRNAMQQMGTNAAPFMARWVVDDIAAWQLWLASRLEQSTSLVFVRRIARRYIYPHGLRAWYATFGLGWLGPAANSEVQFLARELGANHKALTKLRIQNALMMMYGRGADIRYAVPSMLRYRAEQRAGLQNTAGLFEQFRSSRGQSDRRLLAGLAECLKDTDKRVQSEAVSELSACKLAPSELGPLLATVLVDSDPQVRSNATFVLARVTESFLKASELRDGLGAHR